MREQHTGHKTPAILQAARSLRDRLGTDGPTVTVTVSTTAVAFQIDGNSPDYDEANKHVNELAGSGCECGGPWQVDNGSYDYSCKCPD